MAITRIRKYPDPILLRVADVARPEEVAAIVNELRKAIIAPKWGKGVKTLGMAAPQVGISKRVFMVGMEAFVNPYLVDAGDFFDAEEGCFSLDANRFDYKVRRPRRLSLTWLDINGEAQAEDFTGYKAEIIAHEYDHLQGILVNSGENK